MPIELATPAEHATAFASKLAPPVQTMSHAESFKARKSLPKKEILKLLPGTFIQVKWNDAPDTVVLLTRKPFNEPGVLSLQIFQNPADGTFTTIYSDQVVATHGVVRWPHPVTE